MGGMLIQMSRRIFLLTALLLVVGSPVVVVATICRRDHQSVADIAKHPLWGPLFKLDSVLTVAIFAVLVLAAVVQVYAVQRALRRAGRGPMVGRH